MKREIKFRGKGFLGRWHYGHLHIATGSSSLMIQVDSFDSFGVLPETIGQFTGLHDKNGKEIYEGDIVKFSKWDGKLVIGLVKWDDCNPCMCIEYKTEYKQTDCEYDFIKCGKMEIEVIGNIHDNSELLNKYMIMNDIAHCVGSGCPLKDKCLRYELHLMANKLNNLCVYTEEKFNKEKKECLMFRKK